MDKSHGVVVNLSKLEDMDQEFQSMTDCEYAGFGGHEQYFYPDYYGYQPDHGEKLLKACKIMAENGFQFIFAEDLV